MKYVEIRELGEIVTGKTPPTENPDFYGGEYPFITPSDIVSFDKKYLQSTDRTLSTLGANKIKSSKLPANSICFVCIGSTIGKMCMTNCVSYTNQQINSIIPNEKCDSDYLFYLLRYANEYFRSIGAGTGSGKGIVNKTIFSKTKIQISEKKEHQQRIASILSVYDNLIENNNKRIKILEQMAENLYKEWFVRFRFPDYQNVEFENSPLGKIPKTFSVVKMKDVIDDYIGGGWGNDDSDKSFSIGAYVIRGTDFPNIKTGNISSCPFRYHKSSNYSSRKLKKDDIIIEVSGGTAEQPVGRTIIITEGILNRFSGKVICASFCKMLRLKYSVISPMYFIYWMNYLYQSRIIDKFQLQSTGIINFKFEYFLRKGDVLLPPQNIMIDFANKVEKIKDQINKIAEINDNLIKQRDMLLPRLMSGKLEV